MIMDKAITRLICTTLLVVALLLSSAALVSADDRQVLVPTDNYEATLRLYVVEPVSRWQDAGLVPYSYGFLDFAAVELLSIPEGESWTNSMVWNGTAQGFGNIQQGNIMIIAVLFNADEQVGDAFPPYGYWFDAYYVDATATTTPGVVGQDEATAPYTHTVFIEEGTETG